MGIFLGWATMVRLAGVILCRAADTALAAWVEASRSGEMTHHRR